MNRLFFSTLLLSACLTSAASAQVNYDLTIDRNASAGNWNGNTSLGPLNGNKNFHHDGLMEVGLGAPSAPFHSIRFNGGDYVTDPATLRAEIPNPIPFTPPLVVIRMENLNVMVESAEFPVAANGDYNADVILTFLGGQAVVDPQIGATTIIPLTGNVSEPIPVTGNVSQSGNNVNVEITYFSRTDFSGPGLSGFFEIGGTVSANAPVQSANLNLAVNNLVAGQTASFAVTGGFPESDTYLVYSLSGPGSPYIPLINVTLGVSNPVLLAGPTSSNLAGNVTWPVNVPSGTSGLQLLFQAAQQATPSNVVAATVG